MKILEIIYNNFQYIEGVFEHLYILNTIFFEMSADTIELKFSGMCKNNISLLYDVKWFDYFKDIGKQSYRGQLLYFKNSQYYSFYVSLNYIQVSVYNLENIIQFVSDYKFFHDLYYAIHIDCSNFIVTYSDTFPKEIFRVKYTDKFVNFLQIENGRARYLFTNFYKSPIHVLFGTDQYIWTNISFYINNYYFPKHGLLEYTFPMELRGIRSLSYLDGRTYKYTLISYIREIGRFYHIPISELLKDSNFMHHLKNDELLQIRANFHWGRGISNFTEYFEQFFRYFFNIDRYLRDFFFFSIPPSEFGFNFLTQRGYLLSNSTKLEKGLFFEYTNFLHFSFYLESNSISRCKVSSNYWIMNEFMEGINHYVFGTGHGHMLKSYFYHYSIPKSAENLVNVQLFFDVMKNQYARDFVQLSSQSAYSRMAKELGHLFISNIRLCLDAYDYNIVAQKNVHRVTDYLLQTLCEEYTVKKKPIIEIVSSIRTRQEIKQYFELLGIYKNFDEFFLLDIFNLSSFDKNINPSNVFIQLLKEFVQDRMLFLDVTLENMEEILNLPMPLGENWYISTLIEKLDIEFLSQISYELEELALYTSVLEEYNVFFSYRFQSYHSIPVKNSYYFSKYMVQIVEDYNFYFRLVDDDALLLLADKDFFSLGVDDRYLFSFPGSKSVYITLDINDKSKLYSNVFGISHFYDLSSIGNTNLIRFGPEFENEKYRYKMMEDLFEGFRWVWDNDSDSESDSNSSLVRISYYTLPGLEELSAVDSAYTQSNSTSYYFSNSKTSSQNLSSAISSITQSLSSFSNSSSYNSSGSGSVSSNETFSLISSIIESLYISGSSISESIRSEISSVVSDGHYFSGSSIVSGGGTRYNIHEISGIPRSVDSFESIRTSISNSFDIASSDSYNSFRSYRTSLSDTSIESVRSFENIRSSISTNSYDTNLSNVSDQISVISSSITREGSSFISDSEVYRIYKQYDNAFDEITGTYKEIQERLSISRTSSSKESFSSSISSYISTVYHIINEKDILDLVQEDSSINSILDISSLEITSETDSSLSDKEDIEFFDSQNYSTSSSSINEDVSRVILSDTQSVSDTKIPENISGISKEIFERQSKGIFLASDNFPNTSDFHTYETQPDLDPMAKMPPFRSVEPIIRDSEEELLSYIKDSKLEVGQSLPIRGGYNPPAPAEGVTIYDTKYGSFVIGDEPYGPQNKYGSRLSEWVLDSGMEIDDSKSPEVIYKPIDPNTRGLLRDPVTGNPFLNPDGSFKVRGPDDEIY